MHPHAVGPSVATTPALETHLGYDLCEGAAGLFTDPHFVLGAQGSAHGLQLGVGRLVGEGLDAELWPAGGIQLQVLPHRCVRQTRQVDKQPAGERLHAEGPGATLKPGKQHLPIVIIEKDNAHTHTQPQVTRLLSTIALQSTSQVEETGNIIIGCEVCLVGG